MATTEHPLEMPWQTQPEAAAAVASFVARAEEASAAVRRLAQAMRVQTGTRLLDWIDHVRVLDDDPLVSSLLATGFTPDDATQRPTIWRHSAGLFPAFVVDPAAETTLAIKVESCEDFLAAHDWCEPTGPGQSGRLPVPRLRPESRERDDAGNRRTPRMGRLQRRLVNPRKDRGRPATPCQVLPSATRVPLVGKTVSNPLESC